MIDPGLPAAVRADQGVGEEEQISIGSVVGGKILPALNPAWIMSWIIHVPPVGIGRQVAIVIIRIHRPSQGELFEVRHALYALGLQLGPGQGGQKQRGQDGNNRDDDQKFNQGETWGNRSAPLGAGATGEPGCRG